MTDKRPAEQTGDDEGRPKLPPRRKDWHSGLKREKADDYKATAPGTVSDFLASQRETESSDWDDVEEPRRKEYVGVFSGTPAAGDESPPDDVPPPKRETLDFYHRRTRFSDLLIALLLAVIAFFAVATTYRGFGHSWDEALYLKPAERAAAWMVGVINSGDDLMLQRDAVDRHWGQYLDGHDPLHPEVAPVPKLLIGAGLTYLQPMFNLDPMVAMRLPNAILFGLTIALLYLLGTREYGRIGGFAAALFYLLMPRVFGHAHIAASETPLAFCIVLTVYCFLVATRFWPFAFFTGVAFGLAAATKITALILPVPLMLWGQIYKRRDYASNVFAMAFVAPVVMLAVWPWLWYDGLRRFFFYLNFYLTHQSTAVYYMGRLWGYGRPPAPFYYPLHIAALAVPVWLLVFLAFGLLRALFATIRRPATILFILMAITWFGLSMLSAAPRYDGERLFFPVFPFIALIAAGGFSAFFVAIHKWRERRHGASAVRETGYIGAIVLVLIAMYGAADLYFSHPNQLNYYNWLVGRTRGAEQRGFETSYWGEAVNEDVLAYLNQTLQPGDKVKTLALNELAFENLRRWGKLPEKVDFSPDEPPYDYIILQNRQGFMVRPERQIYRSKTPLRVFSAQGVPRILVYSGADMADIFPPPAQQEPVTTGTTIFDGPVETTPVDATTTALESLTTSTAISPADITEVGNLPTSPTVTTGTPVTTAPAVLDLPSTQPVTTSPAEAAPVEPSPAGDITTAPPDLAVEQEQPVDIETTAIMTLPPIAELDEAETSAPRIYDGDLPSTAPVEAESDDGE